MKVILQFTGKRKPRRIWKQRRTNQVDSGKRRCLRLQVVSSRGSVGQNRRCCGGRGRSRRTQWDRQTVVQRKGHSIVESIDIFLQILVCWFFSETVYNNVLIPIAESNGIWPWPTHRASESEAEAFITKSDELPRLIGNAPGESSDHSISVLLLHLFHFFNVLDKFWLSTWDFSFFRNTTTCSALTSKKENRLWSCLTIKMKTLGLRPKSSSMTTTWTSSS